MIGYHAVPVIADAYLKGIRGYSADEALQAMVASASLGRYAGLDQYMSLGWVPADKERESVSKTVEYAFDDWTLARMAAAMGREEVASRYRPTPDGLAGNDDLGQMSAWLLFTALGFYPVTPGSGEYVIGRPFVRHAVLHLPNGKRFTVSVDGLTSANGYVGAVRLNDKPLAHSFIRHQENMAGGELHFVMQARPNKHWGVGMRSRPYSLSLAGE